MTSNDLRRIVYSMETSSSVGEANHLVVTQECNGAAAYSLGNDAGIQLVGWGPDPSPLVDAVLWGDVPTVVTRPEMIFRPEGSFKVSDELKWVVYRKEIQPLGKQELLFVVTRELNGCVLFCYTNGNDRPLVYGRYPNSTAAIDDLVKRLNSRH